MASLKRDRFLVVGCQSAPALSSTVLGAFAVGVPLLTIIIIAGFAEITRWDFTQIVKMFL